VGQPLSHPPCCGRWCTQCTPPTELPTCDQRKPLDAVKVGVLDGHDAGIRKQLLGEVVDELAVDKHVDAVPNNRLALLPHLLLLRSLDVRHLAVRRRHPGAVRQRQKRLH
jgi:hypothetical protein